MLRTMISMNATWKKIFPTRALAVLLSIGLFDLISTAVLHAQGQIVELNPVMRPLIEQSEWLFVFVKGLTLFAAWYVMHHYSKDHLNFIRKACIGGSVAYITVWSAWFIIGSIR